MKTHRKDISDIQKLYIRLIIYIDIKKSHNKNFFRNQVAITYITECIYCNENLSTNISGHCKYVGEKIKGAF